jgi:hypothetical protein
MAYSERLARPPGRVSVSELMMVGLLCEEDVRQDGSVDEVSRHLAEMEYRQFFPNRSRRRRRRNRPQSANARLDYNANPSQNISDLQSNDEQPRSTEPSCRTSSSHSKPTIINSLTLTLPGGLANRSE